MKTTIATTALLLLTTTTAGAALPPKYQNVKDFEVMVDFVKTHELVLETLKSVDFEHFTVHYGNGCEATFERKGVFRAPGWVGPAAPLAFERSSCAVD